MARRRDRGRGLGRVLRHRLGHVEKAGGAVAHHRPVDVRIHHVEERREGAKERLDERDDRQRVANTEVEVDGAVGAKVEAEGRSEEAALLLERKDELDLQGERVALPARGGHHAIDEIVLPKPRRGQRVRRQEAQLSRGRLVRPRLFFGGRAQRRAGGRLARGIPIEGYVVAPDA